MVELRHPHESKTVGGVSRLVRENFTARLVRRGEGPLIIQNGNVFTDGGELVKDIPDWLWEEYAGMSSDMQEKLQLKKAPVNKKT